jgi:hypothetical protein
MAGPDSGHVGAVEDDRDGAPQPQMEPGQSGTQPVPLVGRSKVRPGQHRHVVAVDEHVQPGSLQHGVDGRGRIGPHAGRDVHLDPPLHRRGAVSRALRDLRGRRRHGRGAGQFGQPLAQAGGVGREGGQRGPQLIALPPLPASRLDLGQGRFQAGLGLPGPLGLASGADLGVGQAALGLGHFGLEGSGPAAGLVGVGVPALLPGASGLTLIAQFGFQRLRLGQ